MNRSKIEYINIKILTARTSTKIKNNKQKKNLWIDFNKSNFGQKLMVRIFTTSRGYATGNIFRLSKYNDVR